MGTTDPRRSTQVRNVVSGLGGEPSITELSVACDRALPSICLQLTSSLTYLRTYQLAYVGPGHTRLLAAAAVGRLALPAEPHQATPRAQDPRLLLGQSRREGAAQVRARRAAQAAARLPGQARLGARREAGGALLTGPLHLGLLHCAPWRRRLVLARRRLGAAATLCTQPVTVCAWAHPD